MIILSCETGLLLGPAARRVKNFLNNVITIPGEIPSGWQRNGKIQFENVSIHHEPGSPPILNNVNLTVGPGEKVNMYFVIEFMCQSSFFFKFV